MKPTSEWDASLQPILSDMRGKPLNIHSLMANHPPLLSAWWSFRNYAVHGGALSQLDCERIILRVAWNIGSWYEWASHVDRALRAGLKATDIAAMRSPLNTHEPDVPTTQLCKTVDVLMKNRGVPDDLMLALAPSYSTQQIMDIIAIHGMYITLGNMIHTWGLELDHAVAARLPAHETEETFRASLAEKPSANT